MGKKETKVATKIMKRRYILTSILVVHLPKTKETMPQGSKTVQTAKEVCVFQSNWLSKFPWLRVDDTKDKMFCDICIKHKKNNTLTDGSSNFRNNFHWFSVQYRI